LRPRIHIESKAPLAIAGLISVPLYFATLMTTSLAIDRPRLHGTRELPPSSGTEAKVWLAALIVPGILIAVGLVSLALRRSGLYVTAVTGVVLCFVLPSISNNYLARHAARFPLGMDFVKDSDPSNLSSKGEWEAAAQSTVTSVTHWTLALAFGAIVVGVLLEIRRRTGRDAIRVEPPPGDLNTGGAQQITG